MSAKIIQFPSKEERQSQPLFDFFGINILKRRQMLATATTGDDVVNITALWRSLDPAPSRSPACWKRTKAAREFSDHVAKQTGLPMSALWFVDEDGGTWAHYQLAIDYAEWLSPAYQLENIQRLGELLGFK